jgi:hypothetical protein
MADFLLFRDRNVHAMFTLVTRISRMPGSPKTAIITKITPTHDIGGTGSFKDFLKKMKKTLVSIAKVH